MHVAPAKQSVTDEQSDPNKELCFAGATQTEKYILFNRYASQVFTYYRLSQNTEPR